MKFKKRPLVVDAVRLGWDTWSEVCDTFVIGNLEHGEPMGCYLDKDRNPVEMNEDMRMGLLIPSPDGLLVAAEGDWIVRDEDGHVFYLPDELFHKIYEPLNKSGPLESGDVVFFEDMGGGETL